MDKYFSHYSFMLYAMSSVIKCFPNTPCHSACCMILPNTPYHFECMIFINCSVLNKPFGSGTLLAWRHRCHFCSSRLLLVRFRLSICLGARAGQALMWHPWPLESMTTILPRLPHRLFLGGKSAQQPLQTIWLATSGECCKHFYLNW